MRVLVFSDIHNDLKALRSLLDTEADYYVAAGDLVSWARGLEAMGEVLKAHGDRVWTFPGNHESSDQIASFCAHFGLRNFHDEKIEVGGKTFGGLGYSNPTPFHTPGEYTEAQLAGKLVKFAGVDVMICHAPPQGTDLDRIREGLHAGSKSVRAFIESSQPEYFFCGHIHEAEGRQIRMGRTLAVNVGKKGYLLEF